MLLERKGEKATVASDRFTRVGDEEALPSTGAILVSLGRFEQEKDALLARDGELGVWLASSETPHALAPHLDQIELVAIDFPVFGDGRGFSSARLLRERFGYQGEVRAIGDVLAEQLSYMIRSGFDAFDMQSDRALEEFNSVVGEVRVVYQPTGDGRRTALDERLGRSGS